MKYENTRAGFSQHASSNAKLLLQFSSLALVPIMICIPVLAVGQSLLSNIPIRIIFLGARDAASGVAITYTLGVTIALVFLIISKLTKPKLNQSNHKLSLKVRNYDR